VTTVEPRTLGTTAEFEVAELAGRWRSPVAMEVAPGVYGVDDFWLASPFWGIHFNAYADEGCGSRLFEFTVIGAYELLGPSPTVPGARDADFSRIKATLTLWSAPLAGAGGPGWEIGVPRDISLTGFAPLALPSVLRCPLEYDLLGLVRSGDPGGAGDRLHFGQRHEDEAGGICDRRSPGLLEHSVLRVLGDPPRVGDGADFGPADWTRLTARTTPTSQGDQP
jgi:hypothetical protein